MPSARTPRLVFLEVSKVRSYHSTMMDGFVRAYHCAGLDARWGRPLLLGHHSFFEHLSAGTQRAVDFRPIAVVDQDKRRMIRKSLVESWAMLRTIATLRHDDVLLVTTVLPSTMVLVEFLIRLLPKRHVVVLQHNDLESACGAGPPRFGSFGHITLLWHRLRGLGSRIELAVLDRFIAEAVIERFPKSVDPRRLHVIELPMVVEADAQPRPIGPVRCCFIGYRIANKGYDRFERLAGQLPELEFRTIGDGFDRNLMSDEAVPIASNEDFRAALQRCDIAIMPYSSGYDCSLSAAATDAVAAGLHLLATKRGCFLTLAREFGPGGVSVCEGEEEMLRLLRDRDWLDRQVAGRADRIARVADSRYGLAHVGSALAEMMESVAGRPASSTAVSHAT